MSNKEIHPCITFQFLMESNEELYKNVLRRSELINPKEIDKTSKELFDKGLVGLEQTIFLKALVRHTCDVVVLKVSPR